MRLRKPPGTPRFRALWFAWGLTLSGCAAGDETALGPQGPSPRNLLGDAEAGRVAFVEHCASCHTSRDGFDIAAFDFTPLDMMRRGLAHVDSATGRDIAAHIESIDVAPMSRTASPFQPGGEVIGSPPYFATRTADPDLKFWVGAFGTRGWPDGLTSAALRAMDPRDISVPLAMPRWSIEGSNEDWMSNVPLPDEVLGHDGGAVRTALADYYASRSEGDLIRVAEAFREATRGPSLCSRPDFAPCFDALRWMASLGGQHYLRPGSGTRVPPEVAQTWWDVGEGSIGLIPGAVGEDRAAAFRNGARWLYLAFSVAPAAFREPEGDYLNTFLSSQGLERLSLFVALRRMVGDGPAHRDHPDQFFEDGRVAIRRSMIVDPGGVVEFVLTHWIERLESATPPAFVRDAMREYVLEAGNFGLASLDGERWPRILTLRSDLLELLE